MKNTTRTAADFEAFTNKMSVKNQIAGTYIVEWDASEFPSGVYYYKLHTTENSETKKLILMK